MLTTHHLHRLLPIVATIAAAFALLACGSGGSKAPGQQDGIKVEVASPTSVAVVDQAQAPLPPAGVPGPPGAPQGDPTQPQPGPTQPQPQSVPSDPPGGKPSTPPAGIGSLLQALVPKAGQPTSDGTQAPVAGRWIDVDVTRYTVRLMDGTQATRTLGPVGVGAQVDTGAYESTQTGTFHVYNKIAGLQWDAPYKTYIADWVGFDQQRANGFHSFLEDDKGNVVDGSTGRISNGCIRTSDSATVYAFSEVGMTVYVHY